MDKLRVQPADEVIEDTLAFIRDVAEATQQARQPTLSRSTFDIVPVVFPVLFVAVLVYLRPYCCLCSLIFTVDLLSI